MKNVCDKKIKCPPVKKLKSNKWSNPSAEPYEVQAHHLLCAVCRRGGCNNPPCGNKMADKLLDVLWSYPHIPLKITADIELARAHYFDVYESRGLKKLPVDFTKRTAKYVERRKDLEVCRVLGIYPNTIMPAFHVYTTLFIRQPSLDGMCRIKTADPSVWPECTHASKGYYESIAGVSEVKLKEAAEKGEKIAGKGLWAIFSPRTLKEIKEAKKRSVEYIRKADRLFIRPSHALCVVCARNKQDPLPEDNLVELRRKMEANPNINVTLTEGCCMVCDPCPVYHEGEHICYSKHPKNILRDLRTLEILGLPPGATLPARELMKRIFDNINSLKDVCGWGDGSNYSLVWGPCGGYLGNAIEEARKEGFICGKK